MALRLILASLFAVLVSGPSWAIPVQTTQYTVVELGDLPSGFGGSSGKGFQINTSGQLSGFVVESGMPVAAIGQAGGQVQRIGIPSDGQRSWATSINDSGQATGNYVSSGGDIRTFLFDGGQVRDIGTLGGGTTSSLAMSNTGYVTGESRVVGARHAYLWDGTTMRDIDSWGSSLSIGRAVSNNGMVAGLIDSGGQQAFLWNGVEMVGLGGFLSSGEAVNDAGQVAGYSYTTGVAYHATFWSSGAMSDLGTLGGQNSSAQAINDAGVVAGWSATADGEIHAFAWSGGPMIDLGALLGDDTFSQAWRVDDIGRIYGIAAEGGGSIRVVRWDPPGQAVVPLPPALWLLSAGFLGYLGLGRRGRADAAA